jgi:tRNA/rRNA methyltransferase
MNPHGPNWRIVLVRPRNPLNIGAAARAMANFGFQDLALVAPYDPAWCEARSAVGAQEVIQRARSFDSLAEALNDVTLVVGTTSGQRRTLDRELISLDELPQWLHAQADHKRAAMIFGSEKTGLSNENMSYCHALVRIPTAARCPSMNLGQAVAVCCFVLANRVRMRIETGEGGEQTCSDGSESFSTTFPARVHISAPANIQSLEHVFERATRVLDEVGYLKPKSREATLIKLRRMLIERGLSNHEAKILGGILAQIEWKLKL